MNSAIHRFLQQAAEAWYPSGERKVLLDEAVRKLKNLLADSPRPMLLFVCTHNSRRSHLARVWAEVVQHQLSDGKPQVRMESAGTEATACNERTIASLERTGFQIEKKSESENPVYYCAFVEAGGYPAMKLWSKTLDDPAIEAPVVAIMTCSDADLNCPIVPGAVGRIRLTYDDPKSSDGTPEEAGTYDRRSAQIAGEMHYVLSRVMTG